MKKISKRDARSPGAYDVTITRAPLPAPRAWLSDAEAEAVRRAKGGLMVIAVLSVLLFAVAAALGIWLLGDALAWVL